MQKPNPQKSTSAKDDSNEMKAVRFKGVGNARSQLKWRLPLSSKDRNKDYSIPSEQTWPVCCKKVCAAAKCDSSKKVCSCENGDRVSGRAMWRNGGAVSDKNFKPLMAAWNGEMELLRRKWPLSNKKLLYWRSLKKHLETFLFDVGKQSASAEIIWV